MKSQKTTNGQRNVIQKEQSWRCNTSSENYTTGHGNINSLALVKRQRQVCMTVAYNTGPRSNPTQLAAATYFLKKDQAVYKL